MRFHLDITALENSLKKINKESVTVGIFSEKKAASIDFKKSIRTMMSADSSQGIISTGLQGTYVRAPKKSSKNISLRKLASKLEKKRGIFSSVLSNTNNKELVSLVQFFAIINKTEKQIRQLEKACKALVRNPILLGDYNPNSKSWTKKKGFNHYGIATGTFLKNIDARFKKW